VIHKKRSPVKRGTKVERLFQRMDAAGLLGSRRDGRLQLKSYPVYGVLRTRRLWNRISDGAELI